MLGDAYSRRLLDTKRQRTLESSGGETRDWQLSMSETRSIILRLVWAASGTCTARAGLFWADWLILSRHFIITFNGKSWTTREINMIMNYESSTRIENRNTSLSFSPHSFCSGVWTLAFDHTRNGSLHSSFSWLKQVLQVQKLSSLLLLLCL